MKKKTKTQSRFDLRAFLAGPRKAFVIVPACLLVVGLGWFTYKKFSVIPPPDVTKTAPAEVVEFLGDSRGWIQMPVPQREQFIVNLWQHQRQASAAQRDELNRAFLAMSHSQKEVAARAGIGILKSHLLKNADQYGRLSAPWQKAQYIKQSVRDFKNVQSALAGGGPGGTGVDAASGFREVMPKDSVEVQKIIVTESTPGERAKAEPYLDAMVKEHEQQIRQAQGR